MIAYCDIRICHMAKIITLEHGHLVFRSLVTDRQGCACELVREYYANMASRLADSRCETFAMVSQTAPII